MSTFSLVAALVNKRTHAARWFLSNGRSLGLLILIIRLGIVCPSAESAVLRVDTVSGNDIGNCGTVATPCASIQRAVNIASDGDTILVGEGTYTYQPPLDPCATGLAVVCIVEKQLTLMGGFSPPNWSTADPTAHVTVIDGENAVQGILVKKTFPGSAFDASLTLQGFTVRRGRVEGTLSSPDAFGGGIAAILVRSLTLRDVVVQGSVAIGADTSSGPGGTGAGGGIYISTSLPTLPPVQAVMSNVTMIGNQAFGGAANSSNRGGFALGGGLFINKASFRATQLTVESNTAQAGDSTGGGTTGSVRAEALGGGIAILRDATVTIGGLSATNNTAMGGDASSSTGIGGTGGGGGLYVEGSSLELHDADVRSNTSVGGSADIGGLGIGGGVTSFDADVVLDRTALITNRADGGNGVTEKGAVGGGGAYLERASIASVAVVITNSIVANNHVDLGTGGGKVGGGGAGIFVLGNSAAISHTTFAQNSLGSDPLVGQAVNVTPRLGSESHAKITDSVIADHTSLSNVAAVHAQTPGATITFAKGLFAGNERDTNDGLPNSGGFSGLGTMVSAISAGFQSPGPPNFDYHLLASSPAVDQATTSSVKHDFDKTFRSTPRDWGADEHCFAAVDELVLSNSTVSSTRVEEACQEIIVGPSYRIAESGDVTLRSGSKIILGNGFAVDAGGRLVVDGHLP